MSDQVSTTSTNGRDAPNYIDESELTHSQRCHLEYFDSKYQDAAKAVNLAKFDDGRLGPWSSYWQVYDLVRQLANPPGKRLLSFGCGTGHDAIRYAKLGYTCDGFDISRIAVVSATQTAAEYDLSEQCRFTVQTAEQLHYDSEQFDVVVGVDVLHHVDMRQAIPEVRRVLKPGGIAIFREPLATPIRDHLRNSRLVTWLIPLGTKNLHTGETYHDTEGEHKLDRNDFRILRDSFPDLVVQRWRVVALLSVLLGNRRRLERIDWLIFRAFPFLRRLGDQSVLVIRKS